jgi:hypothetical protein
MRLGTLLLSITAALLLALGATAQAADRATTLLNELEGALQDAASALEGDDTKDARKRLKLITKLVKKLDKDTTTDVQDVKLLKKVAATVEKKLADEADVQSAFRSAVSDVTDLVASCVLEIDDRLAAAEDGKKKSKVEKKAAKTRGLLEKALAKEKLRQRVAGLFKALQNARKVKAAAEKLPPAQGGGGGNLDIELRAISAIRGRDGRQRVVEQDADAGTTTTLSDESVDVDLDTIATSGDGSRCAWAQGDEIVLVDLVGQRTLDIAGTCEGMRFSTDGSYLFVACTAPDAVYAVDTATGNTVHSTDHTAFTRATAGGALTTSATSCAYAADTDGDGTSEVWVLDAEQRSATDITPNAPQGTTVKFLTFTADGGHCTWVEDIPGRTINERVIAAPVSGEGGEAISDRSHDVVDFGSTTAVKPCPDGCCVAYQARTSTSRSLHCAKIEGGPVHDIAVVDGTSFDGYDWGHDHWFIHVSDLTLVTHDTDTGEDVTLADDALEFVLSTDRQLITYRTEGTDNEGQRLDVAMWNGAGQTNLAGGLPAGRSIGALYSAAVAGSSYVVGHTAQVSEPSVPVYFVRLVNNSADVGIRPLNVNVIEAFQGERFEEVEQIFTFEATRDGVSVTVFVTYDSASLAGTIRVLAKDDTELAKQDFPRLDTTILEHIRTTGRLPGEEPGSGPVKTRGSE